MIHLEAQAAVRLAAKVAVRQQAWTDGRGVLGVPVRHNGQDFGTATTDITVIDEAIDRAEALVWGGPELTLRRRGELSLHVAVRRPGSDDDGQVAVLVDPDRGDSPGVLRLADTRTGATHAVTVASFTGALISGTTRSGKSVAPAPRSAPKPAQRAGRALVWEVDDPAGHALFRGDLELAEEVYHGAPDGSHLLPVLAEAGSWVGVR